MPTPRTRTEAALEETERLHADDPERAELCARARRFKASWIELAEGLSTVRKSNVWKRWGFTSFEDYAKRELHLRQETVEKLTGSYTFLHARAPEVLNRDGLERQIPTYQSIDFLRRAEEQEGAPAEVVAELRRRVLDDVAPLPSLSRQFKEVIFPLDEGEQRERQSGALRQTARRLKEQLDGTSAVPKSLAREVGNALDKLIAALADDEAEAA